MSDLTSLPQILQLEPVGEHLYSGKPEGDGEHRNVVFGGQILAQMIMAAHIDRNAEAGGSQGGQVDPRDLRPRR